MIIGIDPGKSGAVAFLNDRLIDVVSCPIIPGKKSRKEYDERGMADVFIQRLDFDPKNETRAFMEKAQAMPKQGVSSMFNYGTGYGIWIGILAALGIPYELVTPRRWKKDMLADLPGDDQKARSVIAANRLFPHCRYKKKDHNKAEALLIAEWGRRRIGG